MWKIIIIIPLFNFLITACNVSESKTEVISNRPKQTIMIHSKSSSLNKITMLETSDSLVRYQVGNPNFRGQTTVEVSGNGKVNVIFELNSQRDYYTGTLSESALAELRETLRVNNPQSFASSETITPVPGETPIVLTIMSDDGQWSESFWSGQQWQNPQLRNWVVIFSNIAKQISDGKVKY